jgi:2-iminobutanoate/2-iminopropanoate deaminase
MKKVVISSKNAPKAVGPYSQGILDCSKYRLELSGQIGVDPKTSKLVDGGIVPQTEQTLKNIKEVLSEVSWGFENVVKVRVFLADMKDYQKVNEIYAKRFSDKPPARVALAVKELPLGALIEIECTAAGDDVSEEAVQKYGIG